MKYQIKKTKTFTKQYKQILMQKDFKEADFIKVLEIISNDNLLPPKYKNHLLYPKNKRYLGMSH